MNMSVRKIMSSGQGVFSVIFLVVATLGTAFQFGFLYLHFRTYAPGDPLYITLFSLSISALISGGTGIIWSLFSSSKFQLISAGFYVMAFALVLPIYSAVTTGIFPYVIASSAQSPWLLALPTYPMLDFIGFWMASIGGLLSMLTAFGIPRK